jgi:ferric-dicitrate binding protein FerR (iron transport regulator)
MTAEVRQELLRLLSELCDGQLSDTGQARLEELLDADAEGRRLYLEYMDVHARLLVHSGFENRHLEPIAGKPVKQFSTPFWGYVLVATGTLAASLLIQASLGLWFRRDGGTAAPPAESAVPRYVATLVQAAGCIWDVPTKPPAAGARLAPGELHLRKGVARLRADSGSALLLEGPAVLRLDSASSATVLQGKVVFQADETAAPFDLHTPTSTLVDFGTEYAVDVEPEGEEIHVFNGEVRRTPRTEENPSVEQLTAGQAWRYGPAPGEPGRPVPLDEQRFVRQLADEDEPAGDPNAGLLAYEGFDYKDADALRQGRGNGGFGWEGSWEGFARPRRDGDTNLRALNVSESLVRPGSATPSVGGCFDYLGFSKYYRRLATPVRLNTDQTYYLSFLFRRQVPPADPLNAVAVLLRTSDEIRKENSRLRLNVGVGGVNHLFTHLNAVGSRAPLPLDYDRTYLLVAKIAARAAEPDQVFLRVYGAQEAVERHEPDAWTVTGPPFQSDLVFDWLEVHINSLTRQTIDEVRLGTTWASVAAPWLKP